MGGALVTLLTFAGMVAAVFGVLALGSDDAKRFFPDMGTLYLKRLGELISTALRRFI